MSEERSGTRLAVKFLEVMDPKGEVNGCEEWTRGRFRGLMLGLALSGLGKATVIVGRRTFEMQCEIYGLGRSKDEMAVVGVSGEYARPEERRVSWLDPRYSRHVGGRAIDVDFSRYDSESMGTVAWVARSVGVVWGGVWSVRDYAHFEI